MKQARKKTINWLTLCACACVIFCVCGYAIFNNPPFISRLNNLVYDHWMVLMDKGEPHPAPIIVEIDDASLARYGQWPWPRDLLAQLIDKLFEAGIAGVGLDMILAEPDKTSPVWLEKRLRDEHGIELPLDALPENLRDNDALFAAAIQGRPVALGAFAEFGEDATPAKPPDSRIRVQSQKYHDVHLSELLPKAAAIALPLEAFYTVAPTGILNAITEGDGILRHLPLATKIQDEVYPSLAVATLIASVGDLNLILMMDTHRYPVLKSRKTGVRIPFDMSGTYQPLYRGPGRTFPYFSAQDILVGKVPAEKLKGRVAFVGLTAAALRDFRPTPLDAHMPGVEGHATVLDNILTGQKITSFNATYFGIGLEFMLSFLAAAIGVAAFALAPAWVFGPLALLLLGGSLGASYYLFAVKNFFLSPVYVLLALLLSAALILPARFWRAQASRNKIRQAFSRYVAPEVVNRIADEGLNPFQGEQKPVTVIFTDIRGFTSISEKMSPDRIVSLLNHYFTAMTECVIKRQGTLDKFIGDALMAFWNAPVDVPEHERKAVAAALDMQNALERLRPEFEKEFGINLRIGAGIHTGLVQVGNMGSRDLLNYTCIGDNVNLASRLEGLCKQYGVGIVVSADVAAACAASLKFRLLDKITVKGSHRPLEIFTPHAEADTDGPAQQWAEALAAYFAGDFSKARRLFAELASQEGYAVGARLFVERCQLLAQDPPAQWSGVWAFTTK